MCLLALLAALTISASGCLVLAIGAGTAGTVAYVEGDIENEAHPDIDQTCTVLTRLQKSSSCTS